jgi:hypothetical protein
LLADRIREDGEQKMHFVYAENEIIAEIKRNAEVEA